MATRRVKIADLHQQIRDLKNQLHEATAPFAFELQRKDGEIAKLRRELDASNADRETLVEALDALVTAVHALRRDAKRAKAQLSRPLL